MELTSPIVRGVDMAMQTISNKLSRGMELNTSEQLIPITVGAHNANYAFGADMAHFTLSSKPLPEIAVGALADYMS